MKLSQVERSGFRDHFRPVVPMLLLAALAAMALAALFEEDASASGAMADALLFAFARLACGFLNTAASSGSAVSLPLLMLLGMDPHVANATNRVPVLVGAVTAVITFQRAGQVDWKLASKLTPFFMAGSVAGAAVAEILPANDLGPVITGAVLMAFVLLFTKVKSIIDDAEPAEPRVNAVSLLTMLGIGFWAGFIVLDGATYLLLALVLLVRCDFVKATALKALLLVAATIVAFVLFALEGDIHWGPAAYMALGSVAGGYAGVRFAQITTAKAWVYRILVAVIGLELVHLAAKYALEIY
ncbi:MAG: TSUP family transporter [Dehalococcoidia bacterium]|nr:TSUP family transporter [Dehalococcoidia bacterium]